jgi:hypothetical protein
VQALGKLLGDVLLSSHFTIAHSQIKVKGFILKEPTPYFMNEYFELEHLNLIICDSNVVRMMMMMRLSSYFNGIGW